MTNFLYNIINNYYAIYVLLGIMGFIGLPDIYSLIICLIIITTFVSYMQEPFKWRLLDTVVVIFMVYQSFSCVFSDYKFSLWYYGVKTQIIPMLFYFIGRNKIFSDNKMLERMRHPMMFAMVVGLVLYFWAPSWYIARRTASLNVNSSENAFYEVTRLSSFWPWSYTMGFGSLFFFMYYIKNYFKSKVGLYEYFCLLIAILVLFFSQQRVSIVFFGIFLFLLTIFGHLNMKKRVALWIVILIVSGGIVLYLQHYADNALVEYILNRSIQSNNNIVDERFALFSNFWHVSLFGEGLGKYGHAALIYNLKSITDCDYIRLMAELGIIGYGFLFVIYMISIVRAFHYKQYYLFELCILLFFLMAMIGATPLENSSMQPFLLWYCIGRINNPIRLYRLKKCVLR